MDLNNIPKRSGLYCLKIRGGLTKFGVARNLQDRLGSREYKTSIIDDYKIWFISEEIMFNRESTVRENFKDKLRPGFRDYLLGDHFDSVVKFVNSLLEAKEEKLYGLPAIKKILGI